MRIRRLITRWTAGFVGLLGATDVSEGQLVPEWIHQFNGTGVVDTHSKIEVVDVGASPTGDVYALVDFTNTIDVEGTTYTNQGAPGSSDTLFIRWEPNGGIGAVRQLDSALYGHPQGLYVSSKGHVFAWVLREPNVLIGPSTLFRFDADGNELWHIDLPDRPGAIAATDDGRLLITLEHRSGGVDPATYSIGPYQFETPSGNRSTIVMAKFSPEGKVVDAFAIPSSPFDSPWATSMASAGGAKFFLIGNYNERVTIGDRILEAPDLEGGAEFLALFDWDKGFIWSKNLLFNHTGNGRFLPSVYSSPAGICYVLAPFNGVADLDGEIFATGSEADQLAISRWDADGTVISTASLVGLGRVWLHEVSIEPTGDILFPHFVPDPVVLEAGNRLNSGSTLLRISPNGQLVQNYQFANLSEVAVDGGGNIFAATNIFRSTSIGGVQFSAPPMQLNHTSAMLKLGPGNQGSPYIVSQPLSPVALPGEEAVLVVDARGTQPLSFQWQKDSVDLQGEVSETLILPPLSENHEGIYRVIVSNAQGESFSSPAGVHFPPPRTEFNIDWVHQFGYSDAERIVAVDSDAEGNVYFAGRMEDVMLMGDETVTGSVFVAKADRDGNLLWQFGDGTESPFPTDQLSVNDMVVGEDGGIYVCGSASGNGQIGSYSYSAQWKDAFLTRLNPDGTFDWAQVIGGTSIDEAHAVAAVSGGGVVVAGQFSSTSLLLPTKAGGDFDADAFVAKIDADGTVDWAKAYGSIGSEFVHDIIAGNGRATFSAQYDFPFVLGGAQLLDPKGKGLHMFLAEIDLSNGDVLGATSIKGSFGDIEADTAATGGSFVAGSVVDTLVFDGQTLTDVTDGTHRLDGFIGLYGSNGNNWLKQIAAPGNVGLVALSSRGGNLYGVGSFSGSEATFETDKVVKSSNTDWKRFVAKFDDNGSLRWVTALDTPPFFPSSISAGGGDSVYVGGSFTGTLSLDQRVFQSFETNDGPPKNKSDAILFKLTGTDLPPIHFIRHPQNRSLAVSDETTLTAEVSEAVLSWQWFVGTRDDDSTPVAGAVTHTFSPSDITGIHRFWVRAELGDGTFLRSATATIEFVSPPTFDEQPERAFVDRDTSATLMAKAFGRGLSYQWFQGRSGDLSDPEPFGARTRLVTPPITETQFYWARATDYLGQSAASLAAQVSPVGEPTSGYDSWSASAVNGFTEQEQGSATFDSDDPDGDGLGNLVEYALGLEPKSWNGNPLELQNESGLSLAFPAIPSDVSYAVEHSTDGQIWNAINVESELIGETIRVRLPAELPDGLVRLVLYRP